MTAKAERMKSELAGLPPKDRAELFGTQKVGSNQSRIGGLDHIVSTGTIIGAVDKEQ